MTKDPVLSWQGIHAMEKVALHNDQLSGLGLPMDVGGSHHSQPQMRNQLVCLLNQVVIHGMLPILTKHFLTTHVVLQVESSLEPCLQNLTRTLGILRNQVFQNPPLVMRCQPLDMLDLRKVPLPKLGVIFGVLDLSHKVISLRKMNQANVFPRVPHDG